MTRDCQGVREHLGAFADRELTSDVSAEVGQHIASCPDCVAELNTIRMLRSRLRTAILNEPVPDDLRRRVALALPRDQPSSGRPVRTWAPWAAAAMIVIAFGVSWNAYLNWSGPRSPRIAADRYTESLQGRLASVLQVAMTDHIHCAVFRAYPKNPPPRAQMVSDLGPQFKDLMPVVRAQVPERFRLEQAHRCTSSKREYVHMIFRDRSALISLIATIRRPGETLAVVPSAEGQSLIRTAAVDQYQIAAFDAGPFMAYVVSDMPQQENVAIASVLATPVSSYLSSVNPVRVF